MWTVHHPELPRLLLELSRLPDATLWFPEDDMPGSLDPGLVELAVRERLIEEIDDGGWGVREGLRLTGRGFERIGVRRPGLAARLGQTVWDWLGARWSEGGRRPSP